MITREYAEKLSETTFLKGTQSVPQKRLQISYKLSPIFRFLIHIKPIPIISFIIMSPLRGLNLIFNDSIYNNITPSGFCKIIPTFHPKILISGFSYPCEIKFYIKSKPWKGGIIIETRKTQRGDII